jgi:hypothetical protein
MKDGRLTKPALQLRFNWILQLSTARTLQEIRESVETKGMVVRRPRKRRGPRIPSYGA